MMSGKFFTRPRWQKWLIQRVWWPLQLRWPRVFGNVTIVVQWTMDTNRHEAKEMRLRDYEKTMREVEFSATLHYDDGKDE